MEYSIIGNITPATPYRYQLMGMDLSYNFGAGMERRLNARNQYRNDFYVRGDASAFKRFGQSTDWSSTLGVMSGALGTTLNFQSGINYLFRPRKGHTVSLEIDPAKNTLTTRMIKPQVSGWDYSLRGGYMFGLVKNTGDRSSASVAATGAPVSSSTRSQQKTVTSHRANLNLNVYLSDINIASDLYYTYSPGTSKNFSWNSSLYTTVMGKIGITIGTGFTMDVPDQGTKTRNYLLYSRLSYRISRTGNLSLNANYSKTTPGNATLLEITPTIGWRWRTVFVDLDLTFKKEKNGDGSKITERKVMLRVTRPFKIL